LLHRLLNNADSQAYVSSIVNLELHLGQSIVNKQIQAEIKKILSYCTAIDITLTIAGLAGDLKRKNNVEIPDALIAATCLIYDLILITRNVKHFQYIPNLKLETTK